MPEKSLIFPKYPLKTKVKIKSGNDLFIGWIKNICIAPNGHIARMPGSLIYLVQVEWYNGKTITDNLVTTAGENEIIAIIPTK
ncbi:MAG: hypothetical protein NTZ49_03110 [Candidatus Parcubacteria bacterium]|nr:hypothetical protein [Candidatus Parcubacteria bacterium]